MNVSKRLAVVLVTVWTAAFAWAGTLRLVVNPYEGTDWSQITQHKANLHTHTLLSGGKMLPDQVFAEYASQGYTILAVTEHDMSGGRITKSLEPLARFGLLSIPAQEYSKGQHVNGYFLEHETQTGETAALIGEIAAQGGLAVLNHPERYWKPDAGGGVPDATRDAYAALLKKQPAALGIEVYNRNERSERDAALWDALLAALMPQRPVWGFANDDLHERKHLGYGWEIFLLRSLTEAEVRQAMTKGAFYFSVREKVQGKGAPSDPPLLLGVTHDASARTITLSAAADGALSGADRFRWIAEGKTVATGPVLDYGRTAGIKGYVRAEIRGAGGVTYTNPFGFQLAE